MKILMFTPDIDITNGGPSRSTVNLCAALGQAGADVTLYTTTPAGEVPDRTGDGFALRLFPRSWPKNRGNSRRLIRAVAADAARYDLAHLHTLWNPAVTGVAAACRSAGLKYVLSPRGMLSAWTGPYRRLTKAVYYVLAERRTVHGAQRVHFLSEHEQAASARYLGPTSGLVLPNGVWVDQFRRADQRAFRQRFGLAGKRLVVFLGRLHPIKQLNLQVEAFARLARHHEDLHWVFVGPDGGVETELRGRLSQHNLADRAVFTGLLNGRDRISALASASVYCQTSSHEGHSVAITEALAAARPCVVTTGCHFDPIAEAGAGLVVEAEPEAIAAAVGRVLLDGDLALQMSGRAQQLVADRYSWPAIGRSMLAAYRQLVDTRPSATAEPPAPPTAAWRQPDQPPIAQETTP
mgnify:CR=1 FL=1